MYSIFSWVWLSLNIVCCCIIFFILTTNGNGSQIFVSESLLKNEGHKELYVYVGCIIITILEIKTNCSSTRIYKHKFH